MKHILGMAALAAAAVAVSAPAQAAHHETIEAMPAGEQMMHHAHSAHMALQAAINSDIRKDDKARDEYRHPAETLTFFGVKPGMTVVDVMPSSGWYSRILIPYLGSEGAYIGLNPELHPELTGYWDTYRGTADKLPVQANEWVGDGGAKVLGRNTDDDLEELAGTADRFLIFREIHNMRRFGWLHDMLVTARKLLKDDGMLGIVQHRADADAPAEYVLGDNGYQREQDVIGLLQAYGFELVARSEINANPKDPANWEGGVWSLPPGYRGAGDDQARRAELKAIGESDRMTLLFRKRP